MCSHLRASRTCILLNGTKMCRLLRGAKMCRPLLCDRISYNLRRCRICRHLRMLHANFNKFNSFTSLEKELTMTFMNGKDDIGKPFSGKITPPPSKRLHLLLELLNRECDDRMRQEKKSSMFLSLRVHM